jgi:hypothetical protein
LTIDFRLPIIASALVTLLAWMNFYFRFKDDQIVEVIRQDA